MGILHFSFPRTHFCIVICNTICYTITMMNEEYSLEWDEEKNDTNIKKHGIGFEEAGLVFGDGGRIEYYDEIHSIDEDRYITIGKVEDVLFVVFTERPENNAIRLISARKANAGERKLYYGNS